MHELLSLPPWIKVAIGAVLVTLVALVAEAQTGNAFVTRLEDRARVAIAAEGGKGIVADFHTSVGWPTRHPTLSGGDDLNDDVRGRVARAVAAIPGVGGVHWMTSRARAAQATKPADTGPYHCERDVETLLAVRVILFAEGSARIEKASDVLLDEVTAALEPCKGSIIAIAGHSDAVGDAAVNLKLSRERAAAVRDALVTRGLPFDTIRVEGYGSARPVDGLDPADPANRRIEFSVISIAPQVPTPVDTPDAG
ncbi:OmpA family protein [Croceicoccus ponticola]|uniref:OmpA family protein n=1 Tax=Croceicoccus ponticola TaxID=2217664 RepID=A0A437GV22_9SPHN|nr:OmpA family protein [Croceicoccus ponticola]RVQ65515.1 OmpA family protein [Croceicoccus ponticola]